MRYGNETTLLLPRSATEAQALVTRILGPLLRHDGEHGTDHVHTLQVMLRHDRSWQQSAAELHIHKQTLGSVTLSYQAGPSPIAYPPERSIRRQTGPFRCQFQTGTRPGSAPRTATSSRS